MRRGERTKSESKDVVKTEISFTRTAENSTSYSGASFRTTMIFIRFRKEKFDTTPTRLYCVSHDFKLNFISVPEEKIFSQRSSARKYIMNNVRFIEFPVPRTGHRSRAFKNIIF